MRLGLGSLAAALGLSLSAGPVLSDDGEKQAVIDTVQTLFDAMAEKDGAKAAGIMLDEGVGVSLSWDEDGKAVVSRSENAGFAESIGQNTSEYLERMWDVKVMIDGPIASLWAPYDFFLDGEFHHCGIDAVQLLKVDGAWKIANFSWTTITEGCAPSPLGPPGD